MVNHNRRFGLNTPCRRPSSGVRIGTLLRQRQMHRHVRQKRSVLPPLVPPARRSNGFDDRMIAVANCALTRSKTAFVRHDWDGSHDAAARWIAANAAIPGHLPRRSGLTQRAADMATEPVVNRRFSFERRQSVAQARAAESKALAGRGILLYCDSLARNFFAPEAALPSPGSRTSRLSGRVGKTFKA